MAKIIENYKWLTIGIVTTDEQISSAGDFDGLH
jgi:hypothetical protein